MFISYPLSIGPACLLIEMNLLPDRVADVVEMVYMPLALLIEAGPGPRGNLFVSYINIWVN